MIKRVLLLVPSDSGTMARRAYDLHKELMLSGHNLLVVIFKKNIEPDFIFENQIIISPKIPYIKFLIKIVKLYILKNKFKPDITISVQNSTSLLSILTLGKDFKIGQFRAPVEQFREFNNEPLLTDILFRFFFSRLNKLFCVSEGIKESIQEHYPYIDKSKIEVVYNAFNFERIRILAKEELEMDNIFFAKEKVILCIGRIEQIKRQDRLILAFNELSNKQDYKLVFIGEIEYGYYEYLQIIIRDLKLDDKIVFLGKKNNPYKYIFNSYVVVSCSDQEGLPGVLIEALILNKKIISTNSSKGVWEILSSIILYNKHLNEIHFGKSGIIIPNNNETVFFLSKSLEMDFEIDYDINEYNKTKFDSKIIFLSYLNN